MKTTCWNCGGALFVVWKSRGRWTFCAGCDTKKVERPVVDHATGAISTRIELVGPPIVVRELIRRAEA